MEKFIFNEHAMVVMSQDELEKMLLNAFNEGYIKANTTRDIQDKVKGVN